MKKWLSCVIIDLLLWIGSMHCSSVAYAGSDDITKISTRSRRDYAQEVSLLLNSQDIFSIYEVGNSVLMNVETIVNGEEMGLDEMKREYQICKKYGQPQWSKFKEKFIDDRISYTYKLGWSGYDFKMKWILRCIFQK